MQEFSIISPNDELRGSRRARPPAGRTAVSFVGLLLSLAGCADPPTEGCANDPTHIDSEGAPDSTALSYCTTGYQWCACNDYLRIASGEVIGPVRELPGSRRAILNCSGNYWTTFTEKGDLAPPTELQAESIFYSDPQCSSDLIIEKNAMELIGNHSDFILALPAIFIQEIGALRCPDLDWEFDDSKPLYRRTIDRRGVAQCTKAYPKAQNLAWPVALVPCPSEVLMQPLGPNAEAVKLCKNPCRS